MERSLEMVKTKVTLLSCLVVLASCATPSMEWVKYEIAGQRTGVVASNADNVPEALGVVTESSYKAPSGAEYLPGTVTYKVASELIAVQPQMAELKKVIAYCPEGMTRRGANCELSNLLADRLMIEVEKATGRKVDVGILNNGGIRVDMPKGDVLLDDIVSMLPFKNNICYVALKGKDLVYLFEGMAKGKMQAFGGAKVVVNDRQLESMLVGGKPVDPEKIYGVATIDFLLDGGDRINVARNAKELIITNTIICDAFLPYLQELTAQGKPVEYYVDDRLEIKGRDK